jgi:molecular chaperone GrpE
MADEYEIPVKVVDRRWWARGTDAGGATDEGSRKPSYVEELERKVADAQKQAQEYVAKYRQAAHEFEDARARMRKELAKDAERSRREVLVSLLEVVDNLERAIDAAKKRPGGDEAPDPLLEGVELVRRQFLGKLAAFGISRIDSAGEPFDPALHEAVTTVPGDPSSEGRVAGVIAEGYRIGDEVLRPALVAVARAER